MKKLLLLTLGTLFLQAGMLPQNVLTKNCLQSYRNSYLSQSEHKAFVYAREKETDKDRCNWGYGYATIEEAIDSAMKGCQSVVLNAECMVVDKDGLFEVKDGLFSKLTPVDDTPLEKEEKEKMTQEAKGLILGNCLPFFTKNYLDAQGHKSFAYSVDVNGNYACGYSYNNASEKISKKTAIKYCNDNKIKIGNKAPKSPCKVYATNKQVLLGAKDFNLGLKAKKPENVKKPEKVSKSKNVKKDIKPKDNMQASVPVAEAMEMAANTLNKDLPKMTDTETRLDSVSANKKKMTYAMTLVHFTNWTMPFSRLKSLLYNDLKSQICSDVDSQMLLKKRASIAYSYSDKDGKQIGVFDFDAKTCGITTNLDRIRKNILNMIKK